MRHLAWAAVLLLAAGHAQAQQGMPRTNCLKDEGILAFHSSGTIQAHGLTGKFQDTVDLKTGRSRSEFDFGVYKDADGFDGNMRWVQGRSGAAHNLDDDSVRELTATDSWLARWGWCAGDAVVEKLPDEKPGGDGFAAWRATPPGGIPVTLRFDPVTGFLRQFELQLPSTRRIETFDDWRDAGGGIRIAFHDTATYPELGETEISDATALTLDRRAPPASFFARPALPNDFAIAGGVSTTVPYEDDDNGRIYLPVFINGKGPFVFALDSGGHLLVTPELSDALHLTPAGDMIGYGGGTHVAHGGLVHLDEIRIGGAVLRDQSAMTLASVRETREGKKPALGILGAELFERFAIHIDRTHKTVTLTRLDKFTGGSGLAVPIRFIGDGPMAQGSLDGVAGWFLIDTGAATYPVIDSYWAERHGLLEKFANGLPWVGVGIGGSYRQTRIHGDVTLGGLSLPHTVVSLAEKARRSSDVTGYRAGLIGEGVLFRYDMTFDYRREIVWIDPEPKVPADEEDRTGLFVFRDNDGQMKIFIVLANSPAFEAGARQRDELLAVNGKFVDKLTAQQAAALMSGPAGKDVTLMLATKDEAPRTISFKLRQPIP